MDLYYFLFSSFLLNSSIKKMEECKVLIEYFNTSNQFDLIYWKNIQIIMKTFLIRMRRTFFNFYYVDLVGKFNQNSIPKKKVSEK